MAYLTHQLCTEWAYEGYDRGKLDGLDLIVFVAIFFFRSLNQDSPVLSNKLHFYLVFPPVQLQCSPVLSFEVLDNNSNIVENH